MAKKAESRLQRRIRAKLEEHVGGWWVKIHGGPYQKSGIPDLLGCVEGRFFALEVKRPDDKRGASVIQQETITDIVELGEGVAGVVETWEQAVEIVENALRQPGR